MKRAGALAAGVALAASIFVSTPSFGALTACERLQQQLDQAELRLARRGLDSRRGSKAFADILTIKQTARIIHCHLT